MSDPRLSRLLQWALANSNTGSEGTADNTNQNGRRSRRSSSSNPTEPVPNPSGRTGVVAIDDVPARSPQEPVPTAPAAPPSRLDPEVIKALMGGPTDAEMMKGSMTVAIDTTVDLETRETALENLESLVQQIDNAVNMDVLKLWEPLVGLLDDKEPTVRGLAALSISTTVQNNLKAQKKALQTGAFEPLVRIATTEQNVRARRRAIMAISSGVRNFQPGLNKVLNLLPKQYFKHRFMNAGDMEAIDRITSQLREEIP